MSASTEKKERQAIRTSGTDKKAIAAQEEAKKKAKENRIAVIVGICTVVVIILALLINSTMVYTKTTALTVDGKNFTPADVNFQYASQYQSFVNNYGSYAYLFGLDTSAGISGLKDQACSMTENGTWKDYFMEMAVNSIKQTIALNKYAKENGIELTEEEIAEINDSFAQLEETAVSYGYASADNFIAANYGRGNSVKEAVANSIDQALASKAYSAKAEEVTAAVTDEEINEQYPTVAVRHILVKAEADEDGVYTDEAKEAAKAKAEEILTEWKKGKATEESFAELAEKYSEDPGSNENGGLYNNVLEGQMVEEFNDFCFDDSRKTGDTGIVYGESGSYAGYHVMYFVGAGDPADNETGRNYIASDRMNEWIAEITKDMSVSTSFFNKFAGKLG